ncbi:hypothetical protein WA026_011183 [Henosepilachna vigintioctopunctata]|uniref:SET domain-containing protein n=1 Tax=Henosepilachna vigintioctopunctata TaxID=420089 RepID=A0AAW1U4X7_9CUCU
MFNMGRAKRTRNRRKLRTREKNAMTDIVQMTRWMGTKKWKNLAKIKCQEFQQTGRGVMSTKVISSGDVLISVPYKLLITYSTIAESEGFLNILKLNSKLGIHNLLCAFLVFEKHKGNRSSWKYYINSLPKEKPKLPWFASFQEMQCFPEDFRIICNHSRDKFEKSWNHFRNSVNPNWTCSCCNKNIDDIINFEAYIWGYTLVNTRVVYLDPDLVKSFSKCDVLLDAPNIALCPMMDMFNHCDSSENIIKFKHTKEHLMFELVTLDNIPRYNEIFICYGRHDNLKLFTEYGFYLPKNSNDKVKFIPDVILKVLNLTLSNIQYGYLKEHQFLNCDELFISSSGISFKLRGFLYVAWNEGDRNYGMTIFGEKYSDSFKDSLRYFLVKLIDYKRKEYECDINKLSEKFCKSNILNYLINRLEFVQNLEKSIEELL